MMTSAELDALAADIAQVGLRHPIVLYQGQILDGRNRLVACEKAGVEPTFTEHEGDDASALALVESLNIERRDLTSGQRSIVAAGRWLLSGGPQNKGGRPRKDKPLQSEEVSLPSLAKKYKVAQVSISQARDLLTEALDIALQVKSGTLLLAPAYKQLEDRHKEEAQSRKDAERVAKYMDAIKDGEMTLEEALQKVMEEEREEDARMKSEEDARSTWLKQLAALLDWTERFIAAFSDDFLAWYTLPGSPGLFDHGITADRVAAAIAQLERTRTITFGGGSNNGLQQGGSAKSTLHS
jgi:hypothetical protein